MTFKNGYSRREQFLHKLAFSNLEIQKAIADIEDQIYSKKIKTAPITQPVFITALPRAGTTLFLEIISSLEAFAAHTYRQMPFLLLPLFWDAVSKPFRIQGDERLRAHGDGMVVGYDSAEALEEVLWKAFWPEKYQRDRILMWAPEEQDRDEEFDGFMRRHMSKLILLRQQTSRSARYVSKNNANIARMGKISRMFPDGVILVPFREPLDHVGSMMKQHENFTKIHAEDRFAKTYMENIGHYDFGATSLIDFNGWLGRAENPDRNSVDFWMQYWCEAYEFILSQNIGNLVMVSYESCCMKPKEELDRMGQALGLKKFDGLSEKAHRFRAPVSYGRDRAGVRSSILERAQALHEKLLKAASV